MTKAIKVFITIILIIVLLVLLAAAACFFYLNSIELNYDDVQALSRATPMPSSERYRFSSSDGTVSILLDKSDIYWSYARSLDSGDIIAEIDSWLEQYDTKVDKAGIELYDGGMFVNLRVKWKNIVPLPVHAAFSFQSNTTGYTLTFSSAQIGSLITFTPEQINRFGLGDIVHEYEIKNMHPLFEDYRSSEIKNSGVIIKCGFNRTWLMEDVPKTLSDYTMILDLVKPEEGEGWIDFVSEYFGSNPGVLDDLCVTFDSNPGAFADSKLKLLATSGTYCINSYFNRDTNNLGNRILPEITKNIATSEYKRILNGYQNIYDERKEQIAELSAGIIRLYADGKLNLSGSIWINSEAGREKFSLDQFEVGQKIEKWNDKNGFCIVWAENVGDYLLTQVPKGNKVPVILFMGYKRPMYGFQYLRNDFWINYVNQTVYENALNGKNIATIDLGKKTTKR